MTTPAVARTGRWIAAVGGALLFASLFLTWSRSPYRNLLVVFGAVNRSGGFSAAGTKTAWQAYSVGDVCLAGLAVAVATAALSNRGGVRRLVLIATGAGLIFTIDQIVDAPGPTVPREFARTLPARFADALAWRAGGGETLATVALIIAIVGLVATLAPRPIQG